MIFRVCWTKETAYYRWSTIGLELGIQYMCNVSHVALHIKILLWNWIGHGLAVPRFVPRRDRRSENTWSSGNVSYIHI